MQPYEVAGLSSKERLAPSTRVAKPAAPAEGGQFEEYATSLPQGYKMGRKEYDWTCKGCATQKAPKNTGDGMVPGSFKFCSECGEAAGARASPEFNPNKEDWECSHCSKRQPPPPPKLADCSVPAGFKFCPKCGLPEDVADVNAYRPPVRSARPLDPRPPVLLPRGSRVVPLSYWACTRRAIGGRSF